MKQSVLLADELTDVERASLASLAQHPGWRVVEKLHTEACKRATEAVIKLDPTEEGYQRKLVALQSKARERNEFSLLILGSVSLHIEAAKQKLTPEEKIEPNRIVKGLNQ
jgi:hypothetical protein